MTKHLSGPVDMGFNLKGEEARPLSQNKSQQPDKAIAG